MERLIKEEEIDLDQVNLLLDIIQVNLYVDRAALEPTAKRGSRNCSIILNKS
jgi:hypothetical protein